MHLPNHLMFGSTLATVPGATVDWYCKGLMTFPRLLLETQDQSQCDQSTLCYISLTIIKSDNQHLTRIMQNIYHNLPSLFLSVHIQTLYSGSVPHVVPTSTFGSIWENTCTITLMFHLFKKQKKTKQNKTEKPLT